MPAIKKPRGTADLIPPETALWQKIEDVCRNKAALYGFSEIRFPAFEYTELFSRGVGNTTDIVRKEMYTFTDRDGRSLTLRPEGTASVCRAVVENGLYAGSLPLKLFYISNFFRYEKPQAGRSREFFQFGCETFGAESPYADGESILQASAVIKALGIQNYTLYINSIGCPNCRPAYKAALVSYLNQHKDKLCKNCAERLNQNPLRVLDCKTEECTKIAAKAPKSAEYLCASCKDGYENLKEILALSGERAVENPNCVRGLDYYTGVVFEFTHDGIGAQAALGGGGRYDGLVAELGGPPLSGFGFALGLSRLILAMESEGAAPFGEQTMLLYLASIGDAAAQKAFTLCESLRGAGFPCDCDLSSRSLKSQMKYADKRNFDYVCVIGEDELNSSSAVLKNLKTGQKHPVALTALSIAETIKSAPGFSM